MTRERDFDQLAKAWLDLGPNRAPDRAVAAALRAAETTPQVRRTRRAPSWTPFAVAAAVALAIVVAGGVLLLFRRGPTVSGPVPTPSVTPSPSESRSSSPPAGTAAAIVLQRSPANLGCDSLPSQWSSATIHIDPASDVYLEIVSPAFDGTRNRVNVDVWAEVDALPPASGTDQLETLPPGTRLAIYWPSRFTVAIRGDTPVILGVNGEEVARSGTTTAELYARPGYFFCSSSEAIWVLDYQPG
jgi:hypothetical protein